MIERNRENAIFRKLTQFFYLSVLQILIVPISFALVTAPTDSQNSNPRIGVNLNNVLSPDAPTIAYEHLATQNLVLEYDLGYFTFRGDDYKTEMLSLGINPKYFLFDSSSYFIGIGTHLRFLGANSEADVMIEIFDLTSDQFTNQRSATQWKTSLQQMRLEPQIGCQWVLSSDWLLAIQAGYSFLAFEKSNTKLTSSNSGLSANQQRQVSDRQENRVQDIFSESGWLAGVKIKYFF